MTAQQTEMDVHRVRQLVVHGLGAWGFVPRDSDGTDFARPKDQGGLRFKVGTSYQEVTTTVWVGPTQRGVVRINRSDQFADAMKGLVDWIDRYIEGEL